MELYGTYTSIAMTVSVALLGIAAGVAKKRLVWKQPKPLPVRSAWRLPRPQKGQR